MKASTKRVPSRNGSALLIILAFILLLTVITTAFLSKALLEKTVSNASADQTRTDVFAAGAVDAILADCQQEIAAGSTITTTTIGSTKVTIYSPAIPTGKYSAKTIVPSRMASGSTSSAIGFPNSSTIANLLKCSAVGVPFYPNGDTTDYPNASSYPPSEATLSSDPSHYDSTSTTSLNGRAYSSTRWNQALLLPKATLTGTSLLPNSNFTVPDWILVQRDGTNPTTWSTSLCAASPTDVTTTNKNPVVGRYAYTIYDEGGLLDMNVAGFPSVAGSNSYVTRFYRSSLATVDLTQLNYPASAPFTFPTAFFPNQNGTRGTGNSVIDAIVGWRNGATLQASGTSPSYSFSTTSLNTNYFYNVNLPGTAFMHTTVPSAVTSLTGGSSNGQSDRKFSSRQQLIDLLINQIAPGLSFSTATMQNALQYMGTFSRDLSQPSYQPDANRPRMQPNATQNGTDGNLDVALYGGNAAASDDSNNYINVPFPSTLVQTAFTRNDGSAANVGDPLVKKRFALNRLAWLTYAGCIATDSGTYNTAAGISNLVGILKAQYGYTDAFLLQGGPTNVQKYFGLQWQQDPNDGNTTNRYKWFYNVHNNSVSAGVGIIRELGGSNGIAASGDTSPHDPDFFELLKATILAGSKGKTLTYLSATKNPTDVLHPFNVQNSTDSSLDYQILQIGANIIDQSRLDAYTTEIIFNNGTGPFEVRGVENYPYLYRIRTGSMCLRNITPAAAVVADAQYKDTPSQLTMATYPGFKDTGIAALMQIPEIWNPHDVNAPLGGFTNAAYPTNFRIVLDTTNPANLIAAAGTTTGYSTISAIGTDTNALKDSNTSADPSTVVATAAVSPAITFGPGGTGGSLTGQYSGEQQALSPANAALTFTVPSAYPGMFREPTMLARPNIPSGSNLALGWTPSSSSDLGQTLNSAGKNCYTGTGFLSDVPNPLSLPTAPATTQTYIGFVLGLYPIQWVICTNPSAPTTSNEYIYVSTLGAPNGNPNVYLTYRMQYQDPIQGGWVTYDEKYINPNTTWAATPTGGTSGSGNLLEPTLANYYQSPDWQSFADPRTSRFGAPGGDNDNLAYYGAPGTASAEWLDATTYSVLFTDRPDYNQGFLTESYRNSSNQWVLNTFFAPGWSTAFTSTAMGGSGAFPSITGLLRWGPLSQNTKSATAQAVLRYVGDAGGTPSSFSPYYYSDADGVVRRAMGGLVPNSSTAPTYLFGYPMATATSSGTKTALGSTGYTGVQATQSASRPYLLKRPFCSVGELGYVFSGTPWKNLDFSNPESGDSPLLDIFCISDTDDPNALVAGKVDLNTQQVPVLAAILAGAYYDNVTPNKVSPANSDSFIGSTDPILTTGTAYTTAATSLANYLVTGPSGTTGTAVTPLMNMRELVGKYTYTGVTQTPGTMNIDGTSTANYAGYSNDIGTFYNPGGAGASYYNAYQTRFREAAMRALSAVGETRVWNLMIDVVAQTGRYPSSAANASNFIVEGERRYWVHIAIDRYTGNILDRQIEEVRQ